MAKPRVVVGLSGGVDSAVAALLLRDAGYEVVGLFMKNWEDDPHCPAKQDFFDVLAITDRLGIEVEAVNFSVEYKERVFRHFLTEYEAGRTPNPDILCNSEIKFSAFLDHALALGAASIATGHYARVEGASGVYQLRKAADLGKDQSYFLHRLNQQQLSHTLFPLGSLEKSAVRALAREAGLAVHAKKDSTGICFIGERPFRTFLAQYLKGTPGPMVTPEGRIVGSHTGLMFYTIGQRQGLGLGGPGAPWYVADKQLATNQLVVVQGHDHPMLSKQTLTADQPHWIAGAPPANTRYAAKTRYRQADAPCEFHDRGALFELRFDAPQWAITPGQAAVLYDGDICLGGGVIRA